MTKRLLSFSKNFKHILRDVFYILKFINFLHNFTQKWNVCRAFVIFLSKKKRKKNLSFYWNCKYFQTKVLFYSVYCKLFLLFVISFIVVVVVVLKTLKLTLIIKVSFNNKLNFLLSLILYLCVSVWLSVKSFTHSFSKKYRYK